MQHKKHILNIIKFGVGGLILCLFILVYAFFLSWRGDQINPTGEKYVPNEEVKSETKVYTNTEYGFQMTMPVGLVEEVSAGVPIIFTLFDKLNGIVFTGTINTHAELDGMTIDESIDYHNTKKDSVDKLKVVSDERIQVDGMYSRIIKLEGVGKADNNEGYRLFIDDIRNDRVYMLFTLYSTDISEKDKKQILDSLLSFKLTK